MKSKRPAGNPPAKKRPRGAAGVLGGTLSYILLVVGISLILSTIAILAANDVLALVKPEHEVTLNVTEELSPRQMGKLLKENDLIRYPTYFSLFASLKDVKSFDTGKYDLKATMDYGQIIDALNRVATYKETVRVTIPEGYSINQIAQHMEEMKVCSGKEFIETANTYPFKHEMLKDVPMTENRLEGYLFPETYEFYKNDKPVNVINKMLNTFVKRYSDEMINLTKDAGLTIAQVVNIASLIEREAKLPDEQTKISGVIHNRLNSEKYPFLNIDATILYVTGHKEALTAEDLKIDSPYNTYTHKGLPPTAICNPGLPAMLSAIQPQEHKYYFYVANPKDGSHVFTKTLDEHNKAVAEMKKLADGQ